MEYGTARNFMINWRCQSNKGPHLMQVSPALSGVARLTAPTPKGAGFLSFREGSATWN